MTFDSNSASQTSERDLRLAKPSVYQSLELATVDSRKSYSG